MSPVLLFFFFHTNIYEYCVCGYAAIIDNHSFFFFLSEEDKLQIIAVDQKARNKKRSICSEKKTLTVFFFFFSIVLIISFCNFVWIITHSAFTACQKKKKSLWSLRFNMFYHPLIRSSQSSVFLSMLPGISNQYSQSHTLNRFIVLRYLWASHHVTTALLYVLHFGLKLYLAGNSLLEWMQRREQACKSDTDLAFLLTQKCTSQFLILTARPLARRLQPLDVCVAAV